MLESNLPVMTNGSMPMMYLRSIHVPMAHCVTAGVAPIDVTTGRVCI